MPLNNIAIQALSNTVPFYQENPTFPGIVGQDSYQNCIQPWQSPLPYIYKALFDDVITIEMHTQSNVANIPNTLPTLFICDHNKEIISSINLNAAPYYKGCQTGLVNNTYTDPYTGEVFFLVTSMWIFKFSDFPVDIPDGGIFYLNLVNQNWLSPSEFTEYFSEPILVSTSHPNTLLVEFSYAGNNYLKNIIVSGWFSDPGPDTSPFTPVFSQRVEGFMIRTAPKVVNVGYLEQLYQQLQNKTQQIVFWKLKVGELRLGIPWYMLDMITEGLLADTVYINKYMVILYNPQNSSSLTDLWKLKGERDESPLVYGECLLMNKFNSQRALVNPVPELPGRLHNEPFDALHN